MGNKAETHVKIHGRDGKDTVNGGTRGRLKRNKLRGKWPTRRKNWHRLETNEKELGYKCETSNKNKRKISER